jgi:hypothetical protein
MGFPPFLFTRHELIPNFLSIYVQTNVIGFINSLIILSFVIFNNLYYPLRFLKYFSVNLINIKNLIYIILIYLMLEAFDSKRELFLLLSKF